MIVTDLDFATVSETKSGLSALLRRLKESQRTLAVTSHGKPAAVLLDFKEYCRLTNRLEEIEATLEVLGDPEMLAGLKNAIAREKTGKYSTFEEAFGEHLKPAKPKCK